MALFKKKQGAKENPYYNAPAVQREAVNPQQPQVQPPAAAPQPIAVTNPTKPQQPEAPNDFSIPLIPTPPPISTTNMELEPMQAGGIGTIDALRLESNPRSIAYIKLSDFKKVLDDIKNLEKRLMESEADLERFSRILESQKEYVKNYNTIIQDIKGMVDKLSAYLTNVEE